MMKLILSYRIDKRNKKEKKTIYLYVRNENNHFRIDNGYRIEEKYWDDKTQTPKKKCPGMVDLKADLTNFMKKVNDAMDDIKKQTNDFDELKIMTLQELGFIEKVQTNDFDTIFNKYIELKKNVFSREHIKKFKTMKFHIDNFLNKSNSGKLKFEYINIDFMDNFQKYLLDERKATNTARKQLQYLKQFLRYAYDREYMQSNKFDRFKIIKETPTDNIALTPDELMKIINIELNERLSKARDFFLFQIFTAQRIGDVIKFDYADVKNGVWYFQQSKTKKDMEIPLLEPAIKILQKYNNNLPIKANQNINLDLKEIGKLAGIDDLEKVTTHSGNKTETKSYKRYELISSHVARRTFETIMATCGVNQYIINQFTGHSGDKTISRYHKPSTPDLKKIADNVWTKFSN